MMCDMVITEIDRNGDGKHLCNHYFKKAPRCYRQSLSFGAFCHGVKRRNGSPTRVFYGRTIKEKTMSDQSFKKSFKRLGIKIEPVPKMTHADLWAFYEHIGYDHKAKKFK
jgi:hypothetical protein